MFVLGCVGSVLLVFSVFCWGCVCWRCLFVVFILVLFIVFLVVFFFCGGGLGFGFVPCGVVLGVCVWLCFFRVAESVG